MFKHRGMIRMVSLVPLNFLFDFPTQHSLPHFRTATSLFPAAITKNLLVREVDDPLGVARRGAVASKLFGKAARADGADLRATLPDRIRRRAVDQRGIGTVVRAARQHLLVG